MNDIYSCPKCGAEGLQGKVKEVPWTYGTEFNIDYKCIECGTTWIVRDGIETYRIEDK